MSCFIDCGPALTTFTVFRTGARNGLLLPKHLLPTCPALLNILPYLIQPQRVPPVQTLFIRAGEGRPSRGGLRYMPTQNRSIPPDIPTSLCLGGLPLVAWASWKTQPPPRKQPACCSHKGQHQHSRHAVWQPHTAQAHPALRKACAPGRPTAWLSEVRLCLALFGSRMRQSVGP
jgi:hypothetical protein